MAHFKLSESKCVFKTCDLHRAVLPFVFLALELTRDDVILDFEFSSELV